MPDSYNMISPVLRRRWLGDGLSLLAGASLPLAFAPFGWYPLAVLALALLFALWQSSPPRRAFWRGWLFGLGMFGVGTSWVYVSIHYFGNIEPAVAALVTVLFVAVLALYPGLLGYLLTRLFPQPSPGQLLVVFPAGWTLAEWVRGWFLTGFPWLNLGYSQIDGPLSGIAPLLGVYGMSWVAALSAALLLVVLRWQGGWRLRAALGLVLLWGTAWLLGQVSWVQPQGPEVRVSLVQGNITQDTKWNPDQLQPTMDLYRRLTQAHWDSNLVIWPETAVPDFYHQVAEGFLADVAAEARASHTDLLIGIPVFDFATERYYNSVLSLGSHEGFYYKRHLVPLGEFFPLRSVLSAVQGFFKVPMSDFSSGAEGQPPLQAASLRIGASICYEAAFGEEIIRSLPAANLLVNVSNDAWFGDSLAPHQHLQMARMRAREGGRYLLRATNTGISAIIDPRGRLVATSPQFQVYVLTGTVQAMRGATPYVAYGNVPVVLGLGILIAVALVRVSKVRALRGRISNPES